MYSTNLSRAMAALNEIIADTEFAQYTNEKEADDLLRARSMVLAAQHLLREAERSMSHTRAKLMLPKHHRASA